jgi:hypothetical protein
MASNNSPSFAQSAAGTGNQRRRLTRAPRPGAASNFNVESPSHSLDLGVDQGLAEHAEQGAIATHNEQGTTNATLETPHPTTNFCKSSRGHARVFDSNYASPAYSCLA